MKAPISWLRDLVTLPADVTTAQLADQFTAVGLTVEHVDAVAAPVSGNLTIGREDGTGTISVPAGGFAFNANGTLELVNRTVNIGTVGDLTATLTNTIAVYCFYKAVDVGSVAEANILNMTYPLFVALFSWIFLRDQRDLMERPFFSLAKTPRTTFANCEICSMPSMRPRKPLA